MEVGQKIEVTLATEGIREATIVSLTCQCPLKIKVQLSDGRIIDIYKYQVNIKI